jgi:hypothetical protein
MGHYEGPQNPNKPLENWVPDYPGDLPVSQEGFTGTKLFKSLFSGAPKTEPVSSWSEESKYYNDPVEKRMEMLRGLTKSTGPVGEGPNAVWQTPSGVPITEGNLLKLIDQSGKDSNAAALLEKYLAPARPVSSGGPPGYLYAAQADLARAQASAAEANARAADAGIRQRDEEIRLRTEEAARTAYQNRYGNAMAAIGAATNDKTLEQQGRNYAFNQAVSSANINNDIQKLVVQREDLKAQYAYNASVANAAAVNEAARFNAQMGFNVEQANIQAEQQKQAQLQSLASSIAEAAKSPGDYGKLAALTLANTRWGAPATAIGRGADVRTTESLAPLESELRTRRDVMARPDRPYTFTPIQPSVVSAPELGPLDLSKFQNPTQTITGANIAPAKTAEQIAQEASRIANNQTTTAIARSMGLNVGSAGEGVPAQAEGGAIPRYEDGGIAPRDAGISMDMYADALRAGANPEQIKAFYDIAMRQQQAQQAQQAQAAQPTFAVQPVRAEQIPSIDSFTPFVRPQDFNITNPSEEAYNPRPISSTPLGEMYAPRPEDYNFYNPLSKEEQKIADYSNRWAAAQKDFREGKISRQEFADRTKDIPDDVVATFLTAGLMGAGAALGVGGGRALKDWIGRGAQYNYNPSIDYNVQRSALPPNYAPPENPIDPNIMRSIGLGRTMEQAERLGLYASGGISNGAYISGERGPELNIPLGDQTLILNQKQLKAAGIDLKKLMSGYNKPKQFADGGVFNTGWGNVQDQDRTLSMQFLNDALDRARAGTPWQNGPLPTPVYTSSPGFSPIVSQTLGSLTAMAQGIPQEYFQELAQKYAPSGLAQSYGRMANIQRTA